MSRRIVYIGILLVVTFMSGCQQFSDESKGNVSDISLDNDITLQEDNTDINLEHSEESESKEEVSVDEMGVEENKVSIVDHIDSELNVVQVIEIDDPDSRGKYEIRFILEEPEIESIFYNRIEIHYVGELDRCLVFNTGDVNIKYFVIYGWEPDYDNVVELIDKDSDGVAEFYLKVKDDFGYDYSLVVKKDEWGLKEVFYGVEYDALEYIDVDEDGTLELMNDHSGGGGYVSAWIGMNLINVFEEDSYIFSYDLTRLYYEKLKDEAEVEFYMNPTNESFVAILEAYANLGLEEECKNLYDSNSTLVENDFDYISYSNLDSDIVEDYFGFVIYRAYYYQMEWENMKNWKR